jgi:hypothetical protein
LEAAQQIANIASIAKNRRNCFLPPKLPARQVLNWDSLANCHSGSSQWQFASLIASNENNSLQISRQAEYHKEARFAG